MVFRRFNMVQRRNTKKKVKPTDLSFIREELEDVATKLNEFRKEEEVSRTLGTAIDRLITSIDHFNNETV